MAEKVIHIGIDPGKTGFITLFKDNEFLFYPMPKVKKPTGELTKSGKPQMKSVFCEDALVDMLFDIAKTCKGYKVKAKIEDVVGRNGWSAERNFNFGGIAWVQRFMMRIIRADIEMVRPQKWQSYIYQNYSMIKMPSSTGKTMVNDTKAMSEMVAKKEYPHINFGKTEKCNNVDHNKTDSFLICLYSIRRD